MYFHNALEALEKDPKFKEWKKEHENCYLSYGFLALDSELSTDWQLGYYDKSKDTITTFAMQKGKLVSYTGDKVFKRPGAKILKIDLEKIKLNVEEVLDLLNKFQKKEYPKESTLKTIIFIQNLPKLGTVWNVTLVTASFQTLNIKVDAATGKIKEHKLASLMKGKTS